MKTYYLVDGKREILRKLLALNLETAIIALNNLTGLFCDETNVFSGWGLKTLRGI